MLATYVSVSLVTVSAFRWWEGVHLLFSNLQVLASRNHRKYISSLYRYCLCSSSQRGLERSKNTAERRSWPRISLISLEWNGLKHTFAIGMEYVLSMKFCHWNGTGFEHEIFVIEWRLTEKICISFDHKNECWTRNWIGF